MNFVLGIEYLVIGGVLILLVLPLRNGSIPMNSGYGFRLRKAFESEDNWRKVNSHGAQQFIRWSLLLLLLGIIAFFIPRNENEIFVALYAIVPLLLVPLIAVYNTYRYSQKL